MDVDCPDDNVADIAIVEVDVGGCVIVDEVVFEDSVGVEVEVVVGVVVDVVVEVVVDVVVVDVVVDVVVEVVVEVVVVLSVVVRVVLGVVATFGHFFGFSSSSHSHGLSITMKP